MVAQMMVHRQEMCKARMQVQTLGQAQTQQDELQAQVQTQVQAQQ